MSNAHEEQQYVTFLGRAPGRYTGRIADGERLEHKVSQTLDITPFSISRQTRNSIQCRQLGDVAWMSGVTAFRLDFYSSFFVQGLRARMADGDDRVKEARHDDLTWNPAP